MGINKIAEFYRCLSYLKPFPKRQFIHPRQTWKKLESNLRFFMADLSDPWEHPRLQMERSKCQKVNCVISGMSIS